MRTDRRVEALVEINGIRKPREKIDRQPGPDLTFCNPSLVLSMFMSQANQIAAKLVWHRHVTIVQLQLGLEWQREGSVSVLDVLLGMGATTEAQIRKAAEELAITREFVRRTLPPREANDERRKFRRMDVPDGFIVTIDAKGANEGIELLNFSLGGLCYRTPSSPALGTNVDVLIRSGRGNEIGLTGQACFVSDDGQVGLQFVELTPTAMLVLDALVKETS